MQDAEGAEKGKADKENYGTKEIQDQKEDEKLGEADQIKEAYAKMEEAAPG